MAHVTVTVTCAQLVKRGSAEIYQSFVEPSRLTRFWLEHASARLSVGTPVEWRFMVPGARVSTTATALDPGKRIEFDWSNGLHVAIAIDASADDDCVVEIAVSGFKDDAMQAVAQTIEGFTIVLCDLKVLLETGQSPRLVADKARYFARRA
jgi:uncharacterized protein YndB with AHSA1/START domain